MKRYDFFRLTGEPRTPEPAADGAWVRFEDAQSELTAAHALADQHLEAAMQLRAEVERLQAALEGIHQERLTWAMTCECACLACEKLSSVIRKTGPLVPPAVDSSNG